MGEKTDLEIYLNYIQQWTEAIDGRRYEVGLSILSEGLQFADGIRNALFANHLRDLRELTQGWLEQVSNEQGADMAQQFEEYEAGLSCSFCGKKRSQVSTMVAGPNVYICDECIRVCVEIVDAMNNKIG